MAKYGLQIAAISTNMTLYNDRLRAAVAAICMRYSQEGASYARHNRPWQDRTHNAKNSLHGKVVYEGKSVKARISHGVEYGIYLERKYSGKYGVLPKVMRRYEGEFLEDIKRLAKGARA